MEKRLLLFIFLTAVLILTACNNDQENYMGQGDPSAPEESEEPAESEESEDPAGTEESDPEEDAENNDDSSDTEESTLTLQVLQHDTLGEYLADSDGMALYYFADDEKETSNCLDACLFNWPALIASDITVPEGYEESDFGTITRSDNGEEHVTYKGYPLYYFRNDMAEGDVNGHGMNDAWFIVNDTTHFPE